MGTSPGRLARFLAGGTLGGLGAVGHVVLEAARLSANHAQGWTLGELAGALALEGALAGAVLVPLLGVAALFARLGWLVPLLLVVTATGQVVARSVVPAERAELPVLPSPAERRTVVLITGDTLRRDHVSAYPDALAPGLTPTLDALAAEGTLFHDAATTAPLTLPSHTTLLSGVHPLEHGVVKNGRTVPRALDAVPAELARAGFRTGAFTSSLVLHGAQGLRRWFHVYRDAVGHRPGSRHLLLLRTYGDLRREISGERHDKLGKERGDLTVARALAWLDSQPEDASVFLWVHLYDAHAPHTDHPQLEPGDTRAGLPHPCDYTAHPVVFRRSSRNPLRPERPPLPPDARCRQRSWEGLDARVASYAEEVRFVDAQVGALLDGLRARGRYDEAGIVFVADHGESLVEHQHHVSHQYSLYDPVVRVPLVVRAPACEGCPESVLEPVSTVRVASTLRWLAGLPDAGGQPHLLAEAPEEGPPPVAVGPAPIDRGVVPGRTAVQVVARAASHKVLRDESGHVERYDLVADPGEARPLVTLDEQERMRRALEDYLAPPRGRHGLGMLPMLPTRGPSEDLGASLAQPGVLGAVVDDAVREGFDPLDEVLRDALRTWRAGAEAPDEPLPDEIRQSLEALGYLQ